MFSVFRAVGVVPCFCPLPHPAPNRRRRRRGILRNVPTAARLRFFPCLATAYSLAAGLLAAPCLAQTATLPAPPDRGGTGEPLPPFVLKFRAADFALPAGDGGIGAPSTVTFSGNVLLVWGDVTLRAKRLVYDAVLGRFDGSGDILLTRGTETVRGDTITFFAQTGAFTATNSVVVSPPYSIAGKRVDRFGGQLRAYNATLAPDPDAKGELRLLAKEVTFVEGTYTELRDVRVYVYGQRVLTLPRYRILTRYGPRKSDIPAIPLRFKYTQISGLALGLGNTWTITRAATADAAVYFPTKNGPQYALSATYNLTGSATAAPPFLARRRRDSLFNDANEKKKKGDANPAAPSALRRFLTITPSPGKDPVLDFEPILGTPESVGEPLEESPRFATLTATYSGKEEIGLKRQGNLLLNRRPEARFEATLPLNRKNPNGGVPFETNAALRDYLRVPRLALVADVSAGQYTEQRVSNATAGVQGGTGSVSSRRAGGEIGVTVLPLLVGNNILVRSQVSYQLLDYGNGVTYRVPEIGVAASYIFDNKTQIGGAVYRREPTGRTPFFFDQIDTRSEAQGLVQGRVTNRLTAAALVRYDIEQSRLFDYGVTLSYRGTSLEPRFGYRKLGGQFSVGFSLVGL